MPFVFFKGQKGASVASAELRGRKVSKKWEQGENGMRGCRGRELCGVLQAYHCKLIVLFFEVMRNHWSASSRRVTWLNLHSERITQASMMRTHCGEQGEEQRGHSEAIWGPGLERTRRHFQWWQWRWREPAVIFIMLKLGTIRFVA